MVGGVQRGGVGPKGRGEMTVQTFFSEYSFQTPLKATPVFFNHTPKVEMPFQTVVRKNNLV